MAYDIYGDKLARGHCEVHPWVAESYPCGLCYAEGKPKHDPRQEEYERAYERAEAEYYEKLEREYHEELARENNLLYRMLYYVALALSKLNERVQKYKDKMFNKVIQKYH